PSAAHVVSLSVNHLMEPTPPIGMKLTVPPGATLGLAGWTANATAPNASGTLAEVEGRCAGSPPYIATTSTDCMPGFTRPGGAAHENVACPLVGVATVIVLVPSVQERSTAPFSSYDWNAKLTMPPKTFPLGLGTETVAVKSTDEPSIVEVGAMSRLVTVAACP